MVVDYKIFVIWWGESLEGECGLYYKKKNYSSLFS